jgi:hypothetical protein
MTFSADGKFAAIRGQNSDFCIFDLASGKLQIRHHPSVALGGIRLSPEGRYFVAYQNLPPKEGHLPSAPDTQLPMRELPNIEASSEEGYLPYVFDTQTKKEIKPKELPVALPYLFFFPGKKKLVFGKKVETWIKERNLQDEKGKPIAETWNNQFNRNWNHLQMSMDGRFIAIHRYVEPEANERLTLQIWDTKSGRLLTHLPTASPRLPSRTSVWFSPDSRFLITDVNGITQIREIASGAERFQFPKGHLRNGISSLTFTPDYRGLLSGGEDTQILLWDFTLRSPDGVWRTVKHSPQRQKELWNLVRDEDGREVHRAIWELIADPSGTIKFLSEKLQPIEKPDLKQITRLIQQTDSDLFAEREKAFADLIKIGDLALPMIREAFQKPAYPEHKRRLEKLLAILENPVLSGEKLQAVRGIEILERINTPEAKTLLEKLSKGVPESYLTQEARFACERMKPKQN